MTKKILLLFFCLNICGIGQGVARPVHVNFDPRVGEDVIKKYFEHMVSDTSKSKDWNFPIPSYWTDKHVFLSVLRQWKKCLEESPDRSVSASCIIENVCKGVFYHIPSQEWDKSVEEAAARYCDRYGTALVETEPKEQNENCKYNIYKIGYWQEQVKYENKLDGTGFIREGGDTTWRMSNPGNLRDGRDACAKIKVNQGGCKYEDNNKCVFAVYETEEKGWTALRKLLTGISYRDKTIEEAMSKYAPSADGNRPRKYAEYLKNALYDNGLHSRESKYYDNIRLRDLNEKELDVLTKAINKREGNKQGKTYNF